MNLKEAKLLIILSVLAAMIMSGCSSSTITTGNVTPAIAPVVGAQAPDLTATTLSGESITLKELRGQPVILNFWATWCGYCRYQIPFLQSASEEKEHEMEFIGVNIGESSDKVQQYVKEVGIDYMIALDGNGAIADSYNVRPIPATFFIDEQGIIKDIRIGAFMSQAELMAVLENIY